MQIFKEETTKPCKPFERSAHVDYINQVLIKTKIKFIPNDYYAIYTREKFRVCE